MAKRTKESRRASRHGLKNLPAKRVNDEKSKAIKGGVPSGPHDRELPPGPPNREIPPGPPI